MNFCPECGKKLEEIGNFCIQCGHKLSGVDMKEKLITKVSVPSTGANLFENAHQESTLINDIDATISENSFNKDKPIIHETSSTFKQKVGGCLSWIGFFFLLILLIVEYGIYKDSLYPKSEADLMKLLGDRFWRISSVDVKEIYVDGKLVSKPTSNKVKMLKNAVEGDRGPSMYESFKTEIESQKNYDSYFSLINTKDKLISVGDSIFFYNQYYNLEKSEYNYETVNKRLMRKDGKFYFECINPGILVLKLKENTIEGDDYVYYVYDYKTMIDEIDDGELITEEDKTYEIDNVKIRLVTKTTYKECKPLNKTKYLESKAELKALFSSLDSE
ncbi:MAG TPA: hypothetical protein DCQ29_07120 [Chitinophagaceae bacterium]|nr:hypothetical protein [Chitinophagaceae bacterium]